MAKIIGLPAASGGWNMRDPVDSMPPEDAIIYDNLVHSGGMDAVRPGYSKISSATGSQIFGYASGAQNRILLISGNTVRAFSLSGVQTGSWTAGSGAADFRAAQMADASGLIHLLLVRGDAKVWDFNVPSGGSDSFSQTSFSAAASGFRGIFRYKNRVYAIENDSFNIWYGGVQAIGGAMSKLDVGAFFKRSSRLLAAGTWTQDGGDGQDDQLCLFSDNGEELIYSGASPEASDWALAGRFDTERLISDKCVASVKADLILGTTAGYINNAAALSAVSANSAAISSKINPHVRRKAATGVVWKIEYWPEKGYLVCNAPSSEQSLLREFHVFDFETGAWSRFLGQNAIDFAFAGGRMFFVRGDGIFEDGVGNLDDGAPVKWRRQGPYLDFGIKCRKQITRLRQRIRAVSIPDVYKLIWTDFAESAKTFLYDDVSDNEPSDQAKWSSGEWSKSKWSNLTERMFDIRAGVFHVPAVYISAGLWGESNADMRIGGMDAQVKIFGGLS